jgi:hypothetical protein
VTWRRGEGFKVTKWIKGPNGTGKKFSVGRRDFFLLRHFKTGSGAPRPPFHWLPGLFPRGKAAGAWSYPRTFTSAEVKNEWKYNSIPPVCLRGADGENVTFHLLRLEVSDNSWHVLENLNHWNVFWLHITGWGCCTDLQRLRAGIMLVGRKQWYWDRPTWVCGQFHTVVYWNGSCEYVLSRGMEMSLSLSPLVANTTFHSKTNRLLLFRVILVFTVHLWIVLKLEAFSGEECRLL